MKNETKFFYVNLLSMVSDALFRILILSLLSIKYQRKNTEENILGQGISQGKIKRLLKDKYPNFEVGLKCILMMNPYLLFCSYIN